MSDDKSILVVANETVGGTALIEAVKRHADEGAVAVHVICPQNQPKHGHVIYDESVRNAAENRLAITIAELREAGLEATGEIADPDPYSAIMDAVGERDFEEIIISTHPETRSGWLRQDLITRVGQATRRPVEHVVVDLAADDEEVTRTLVVANQTVGGQALIDKLEELAAEGPRRFIVICPQPEEEGEGAAAERLAHTLKVLQDEGIEAMGQVAHPDPFTAVQNAMHFFGIDEVVISTFPEARSGWLRADLIERVQQSTDKPVHHVVAGDSEEATA
ncbi:MAG TPA: universal stress protein [Thermoleophilaceae bacterium]|nr:universal stress protein [Thermoleophilaceae bacterium]